MSTERLPPCGVYRTTVAIGGVEPNRLVYFHNHGDPGPGIYPPEDWKLNRAVWAKRGFTLPDDDVADTLEPLEEEGFYVVKEAFTCCENNCRTFEEGLFVQLGYNGFAEPILFVPEWTPSGFAIPEMGQPLDDDRLAKLEPIKVVQGKENGATS